MEVQSLADRSPNMRVLTVDDSRPIRMMVRKLCVEFGCEVTEAENGQVALAAQAQQKHDLIILDITMPVLDGPATLAALRGRGDQTPVLMLTSERQQSIVDKIERLGVSGYVKKPFTREELKAAITKAVGLPTTNAAA
jgi:CheY-like chemotaxis protein